MMVNLTAFMIILLTIITNEDTILDMFAFQHCWTKV